MTTTRRIPPPPGRVSIPAYSAKPFAQNALQDARARGEYPGGAADMASRTADARSVRRQDRYGK